ncbi:MAG: flagellar motor protein MotB, partial [Bacteroidales bacterium]|nr:flagellar motor protein MotB [Bacteroidales bacterium]
MKKLLYPLFAIVFASFMNSCAPVYKCGDAKPEKVPFTWSKNMKAVVSERDKLCTDLAKSEEENKGLKSDLA